MKRILKIILFSLFLFFQLGLYGQEKKFSMGLNFTPRYDYYSENINFNRSFVEGNFDNSNFGYYTGLNFTFYGKKINKHVGIGYARYKFNVNYNYDTPICPYDSFVITKSFYKISKIIFTAGISKQIYSSNNFSIMPSLNLEIPLFPFFPPSTEYFLYSNKNNSYNGVVNYFNLLDNMFKYPIINLNAQFVFYSQSKVGFILSPFIETGIDFWNNPRYSYTLSTGISCVLSFNFQKK
jgi:hypothetical protein